MSDNWVVQNLINVLNTWSEKMAEVWELLTTSPESFKGGAIWNVILNINGAMQAIGLALLVLFFWEWLRHRGHCQRSRGRSMRCVFSSALP